ncbi:MAG: MATE family efflux transporter [Oscillospiraceae bacterium]|nr:MATE family efflux transporter [Oscillospiraceae bacterium]
MDNIPVTPISAAEQPNVITAEELSGAATPSRADMRKRIFTLAWPATIELMLSSMISMINMWLVSSLGAEAVSAVGVTGQPIMIPWVLIQAFSIGGTAIIARSLGERNEIAARRASEQMLFLAAGASILCGAILFFFGSYIISWMGATPDYFSMAALYMRFSAVGVIFQSITTTVAAILRGAGRTRLTMRFNIIANITNVSIGFPLIYGLGPIPSLGIMGAGIAVLSAHVVGCTLALMTLFRSKSLPIHPNARMLFTPDASVVQRISRIGVSSALEQLSLRVGLILFTIYVIRLGTAEYAAHNIAGSVHNYVVNIGSAFSIALVSLVGQNLGAKRADLADKYFMESIKLCLACSAFFMVILLLFPRNIATFFTKETDVIDNIVIALRILALFVPSQIIQITVCGGLRGGGDTKWPLISTMIGVLVMRMVLGYFFIVVFEWGIAGAWLCWLLDQTSRMVIILIRYKRGKWKNVTV